MSPIESLWGEEFNIPSTQEVAKKVISKISGQTEAQKLKSKKTPIEEKIALITQNVYKILGHLKDDTVIIKTREELHSYIDKAISNEIIAIDTETNNSVDTLTCKLMGGCIYTPGEKSAYIPINHVNRLTGERLAWQLTERDIKEEFDRLQDPSLNDRVKILTHNGKFDYKVLLKTTGFDMNIYWDSYVGARLLNENEAAGLKFQYIDKINPNQEKYDIEHLFEGMEYAIFDPDLFALYAATDAMMTYELYLWQKKAFEDPSLAGVYHLMMTEEMPLIKVVANMELRGISLDKEYASRLSIKYHAQMEECLKRLEDEVNKYNDKVSKWRLTPEANNRTPNKKGDGFNKSKSEQLEDPIKISSPTQLAILLYDVLKCPSVSTKSPRGTGVDELKALAEKTKLPLCKIILDYRATDKLLNTFIDKLPEDASDVDGRVHCEFKSLGTDCIVGDSLILTPTGVDTIENIVGEVQDREYSEFKTPLINELGNIEYTSHKIKFENVPTYKINTYYGFELEGTPNHPIRVLNLNQSQFSTVKKSKEAALNMWDSYSWKKLEDIQVGDYIIISKRKIPFNQDYIPTKFDQTIQNKTHKKSTKMPEFFDENFAELLGMFQADGSLNNNAGSCKLALHNEQPEVVSRWKELCEYCFEASPVYEDQGPKSQDIISNWYINGKKLNQLNNYIHTGKTRKRIPKEILNSNDKVFNSYIRGLTLDSSNFQGDSLDIIIFDKRDAQAAQLRFLAQGVLCTLFKTGIKDGRYEYGISFTYDSLKWFYENVGVIQSHKIINIPTPKQKLRRFESDNYFAIMVRSKEESINTVYDFTLPETHSFISNGFISHNTGRFSSANPNLQQLPRSNIECKPMFRATPSYEKELEFENSIVLSSYDEVETSNGWKKVKELQIGDIIDNTPITNITKLKDSSIRLDFGGLDA